MSSTVSDFKHRLFKYIITIKQMKSNFIYRALFNTLLLQRSSHTKNQRANAVFIKITSN